MISNSDRSVPWFKEGDPELSDGTKELLERYSHIPSDQVLAHLHKIVCAILTMSKSILTRVAS